MVWKRLSPYYFAVFIFITILNLYGYERLHPVSLGKLSSEILAPASGLPGFQTQKREAFDVVSLIAAMQGNSARKMAGAIGSGRESDETRLILKEIPPKTMETMETAFDAVSTKQFSDLQNRPVIELILNAIDTTLRDRLHTREADPVDNRVHWFVQNGKTTVRDWGEGISLLDLPKLLNPGEGANMGQSGTTGLFGAGFLANFSYLEGPEDRLIIQSVTGQEANRFEFFRDEDDGRVKMIRRSLSALEADRLGQGTEVIILSKTIQKSSLIAAAQKFLVFKGDARIEVFEEGERQPWILNPQEGVHLLAQVAMSQLNMDQQSDRPAVTFKEVERLGQTVQGESTSLHLLVNGVYFDTVQVETYHQPKVLLLDLNKYLVEYARERGMTLSTQKSLQGLEALVEALYQNLTLAEFLKYANLLFPLLQTLQRKTAPAKKGEKSADPVALLKARVQQALERPSLQQKVVLAEQTDLAAGLEENENVIFIRKELLPEQKPRIPEAKRDREYPFVVYLPFKQSEKEPIFAMLTQEGDLVVDPQLKPLLQDPQKKYEVIPLLQSIRNAERLAKTCAFKGDFFPSNPPAKPSLTPKKQEGQDPAYTITITALSDYFDRFSREAENMEEFRKRERFFDHIIHKMVWNKGAKYSIRNFVNRVGLKYFQELQQTLQYEESGKPKPPRISEKSFNLLHKRGFDQESLESQWDITNSILEEEVQKEIFSWWVYLQLLSEYESNNDRITQTYNPGPVIARIYRAGRISKHDCFLAPYDAVASLLAKKHVGFYGDPFSLKKRFPDELLNKISYYIQFSWEDFREFLILALIEKRQISPEDLKGLRQAFDDVDEMLLELWSEFSKEEMESFTRNNLSSLKTSLKNYSDLATLLKKPQSLPLKLAVHLYPLFGEGRVMGEKPEQERFFTTAGGHSFPLSEILLAQNLNRSCQSAFRQIASASELVSFLKQVFDQRILPEEREELLARSRASLKRAYEQTVDPFAFLREVVTNAYEANFRTSDSSQRKGVPTFEARTWIEADQRLVLSMADQGVGMSFIQVFMDLLQPSASGWESDQLHFGQGFYSLFRLAEEIRLQTTQGGKTTFVKMIPLRGKGTLQDIQIEIEQRDALPQEQGTRVEWVCSSDNPLLLAAEIYVHLNNYVGLFDPQKMKILFNGEPLNQNVQPVVTLVADNGDHVSFFESPGRNAFSLNGLFMREMNPAFLSSLPPIVRQVLTDHGVWINLDAEGVEPLEGRADFVNREEKISRLANLFRAGAMYTLAHYYFHGAVDLSAYLPNDLVSKAEQYALHVSPSIQQDARRIGNKEAILDWTPYLEGEDAARNGMLLMLFVPVFSVGNQSYSFISAVIEAKNGNQELIRLLPQHLQQQIENRHQSERKKEETTGDQISPHEVDFNTPHTEILWAWKEVVEAVLYPLREEVRFDIRHQFYQSGDESVAHTSGSHNIAWNLSMVLPQLETLNKILSDKTLAPLILKLSEDSTSLPMDPADIFRLYYVLDYTTTHEWAHILRGESEYQMTHNPEFYRYHAGLLNRLLDHFLKHPDTNLLTDRISGLQQETHVDSVMKLPSPFSLNAEIPSGDSNLPLEGRQTLSDREENRSVEAWINFAFPSTKINEWVPKTEMDEKPLVGIGESKIGDALLNQNL